MSAVDLDQQPDDAVRPRSRLARWLAALLTLGLVVGPFTNIVIIGLIAVALAPNDEGVRQPSPRDPL